MVITRDHIEGQPEVTYVCLSLVIPSLLTGNVRKWINQTQ